jgi:polysaccharide biosynthesis/export protein
MRPKQIFSCVVLLLLIVGCRSGNQVGYLTNSDIALITKTVELKIQPGDNLDITVSDQDYKAIMVFMKYVPLHKEDDPYRNGSIDYYVVDNQGNVNFPMLGNIHISGLTLEDAQNYIKNKIQPYMAKNTNPIVQVRIRNFHVTVLGEVTSPQRVDIPESNEKFTIFDALSGAGDMTIYGKRNNVKIIREDSLGGKSIHLLNLNDANIINSPYYYMKQNDIIYVEPNKAKSQESKIGETTGLWISGVSIFISFVGLIYSLLK